jgi:alpha-methylacyl-CoA racemase
VTTCPQLAYGGERPDGDKDGLYAATAGHDLTYLAVALGRCTPSDERTSPAVPLNVGGNFGGGGAFLVIGVLAALHSARFQDS